MSHSASRSTGISLHLCKPALDRLPGAVIVFSDLGSFNPLSCPLTSVREPDYTPPMPSPP
eukprot:scaffold14159_cov115-Isochrysis_galbana.AAC.5